MLVLSPNDGNGGTRTKRSRFRGKDSMFGHELVEEGAGMMGRGRGNARMKEEAAKGEEAKGEEAGGDGRPPAGQRLACFYQ